MLDWIHQQVQYSRSVSQLQGINYKLDSRLAAALLWVKVTRDSTVYTKNNSEIPKLETP